MLGAYSARLLPVLSDFWIRRPQFAKARLVFKLHGLLLDRNPKVESLFVVQNLKLSLLFLVQNPKLRVCSVSRRLALCGSKGSL